MSELCRHLGVTSSALSASVTATPKSGAVRGKEAAQPKPPNAKKKKNDDEADKRGSCEQPARSTVQRGGLSSPALYREAVENPYAVRAPSAPPPSEAGAGAASSEQPRVGNLVEKSRPSPRPMILLPRRRIFYSSTFVRWVPDRPSTFIQTAFELLFLLVFSRVSKVFECAMIFREYCPRPLATL